MEDWREVRRWLFDPEAPGVKVASHRGKYSASVLENTSLAFLTALEEGADMVEMDLDRTKDGCLVGHHDRTMARLFHREERIEEYTFAELESLPLYNYLGEIGTERLESFDEILTVMRDRALLVLDKCWDYWDEVYAALARERMLEQAVFKFYIRDGQAVRWAKAHPDCTFIPMMREVKYLDQVAALKQEVPIPALEIGACCETDDVFQPETFAWLKEHGLRAWCNSLSLAKRLTFGGGYDDLKSLRFGGDAGWGVLVRRGVRIIQTDWPAQVKRYLQEQGFA